ncbi:hypothetical protein ACTFIW_003789 [Dictyostelium discoideum]
MSLSVYMGLSQNILKMSNHGSMDATHLLLTSSFLLQEIKKTLQALDHLRRRIAKDLNLIPNGAMVPVWITDFPLFSWNEDVDRIESEHHPFTSPHLLGLVLFEKNHFKLVHQAMISF